MTPFSALISSEVIAFDEFAEGRTRLLVTVVPSPKSAQRNEVTLAKRVCRRRCGKVDFELIASCNGIKRSAHMVTALGALLTGRANAAHDLNLESNQARDQ
ncbi:unnamed protein product [Echinostoma caproni]|uniref:Transposase n=1 Tax=Echinostoma caproni TaxID=27848 RepID=A0A183A5A3_9TREM|nr:unnamed protein product [Echinostoma caproni]